MGWQPTNVLEQALLDALQRGDREGCLRLLADAPLLTLVRVDSGGQVTGWVTSSAGERTFLLGYTSTASLAAAAGGQELPHLTTSLPELARRWPDRTWWLAVNSGLPIEVVIPPEQFPQPTPGDAAGPARAPGPAPDDGFVPANDVEQALLEAVREGDNDAYLKTMLRGELLIPGSGSSDLEDPNFAWPRDEVGGEPCIPLFTSPERLAERYGDEPHVTAPGVAVVRAWPDQALTLALNAGSPVGATLPGPQVAELAGWAEDVGLVAVMEDARLATSGIPTSGMRAQVTTEPAPEESGGAEWLQKLLPHRHVSGYLERGYHLVSGLAHRLGDVGTRVPLERLYRLLDLERTDSSFASEDPHVHVVRWPAYGDGGYGDARRRSGAVSQVQVAGAPLPHGAVLCRIDRGGEETVVATYDADLGQWRAETGEDREMERDGA